VFKGQTLFGGGLPTPEDLGGDHELLPWPTEFLERLAHYTLSLAMGVSFSVIEEVDAVIPGSTHQLLGELKVHLVTIGYPGTERQFR